MLEIGGTRDVCFGDSLLFTLLVFLVLLFVFLVFLARFW